MQKMDFDFIVKFKNFYEDEINCYLTMEYVRGLELFDVKRDIGLFFSKQKKLKSSEFCLILEYFPKNKLQFYIGSIVLVIEYMHSLGIIYRDLKPENIMVDSKVH